MGTDSKQLANAIKSGEYFEQSRAWYQTMYIGPISERAFFLVILAFSAAIAALAFLALMLFLPTTERPGLLVPNEQIDDAIPRLVKIKEQKDIPLNLAMKRFYITSYVTKREGYSAEEYLVNSRFIQAQSDEPTAAKYVATYDQFNPNSPAAILGANGRRLVTVNSIEFNDAVEPKIATVQFSTDIDGVPQGSHANWTATIAFYYTEMLVTPTVDPETGKKTFKTQDPQFQVVNYALTQQR